MRLPIKYRIAITPAIVVALLTALIAYTLYHLAVIQEENETIRQWARITDRLQVAIAAGTRMRSISSTMLSPEHGELDELRFDYLDHSRIFSDNILYPECVDKMSTATRKEMARVELAVRYSDEFDPQLVFQTLDRSLPELESLFATWRAKKRLAYTDYYDNLQVISSQLVYVSVAVLLLCVILTIGLTTWSGISINSRLKYITSKARAICTGSVEAIPDPVKRRDEIDDLTYCVSRMTDRLINVVAAEKLLEGAEAERKRIAMDMHDQTLADLTSIKRQIEDIRQQSQYDRPIDESRLETLNQELTASIDGLRMVIDDLHPQVIDLLGLVPAIQAYLERMRADGCPSFTTSLDAAVDPKLLDSQKINLYRVAQEAINNVINHAQSNRFEVTLRTSGNHIVLSVEDNGRGMPPEYKHSHVHYGVSNIRERAKLLGAQVAWKPSRFSSGTLFELRMPYLVNSEDNRK